MLARCLESVHNVFDEIIICDTGSTDNTKEIAGRFTDKIFDFEGSEVPAVEEFFRGFRPALKPYSCIQYSKKELLQQIFVKFFR